MRWSHVTVVTWDHFTVVTCQEPQILSIRYINSSRLSEIQSYRNKQDGHHHTKTHCCNDSHTHTHNIYIYIYIYIYTCTHGDGSFCYTITEKRSTKMIHNGCDDDLLEVPWPDHHSLDLSPSFRCNVQVWVQARSELVSVVWVWVWTMSSCCLSLSPSSDITLCLCVKRRVLRCLGCSSMYVCMLVGAYATLAARICMHACLYTCRSLCRLRCTCMCRLCASLNVCVRKHTMLKLQCSNMYTYIHTYT